MPLNVDRRVSYIIGLTRRELVARLGEPLTMPRKRDRRCVYFEQVSGKVSFAWQFCFPHGRVHSASGSPGVRLVRSASVRGRGG